MLYKEMTPKQAIEILTKANEWRRGAEIEQPNPKQLGEAIDLAIQVMSHSYLSQL